MKKNNLVCLTMVFLSFSTLAQWSEDPSTNNSISMANGEQALPKVATSDDGTTYISWFSNESGNYNVRLQKLDVFGNIQWDSAGLLVSDHEAMSSLTDWDMTIDQDNHAILTFQDVRNGNNNIYAYRISPFGEFIWGDDGLELSNSDTFDASPKVTVTNTGNTVIAWAPDLEVIILQKITPEGILLWGESGITFSGDNKYSWPQLLAVGDDAIILKYFEDIGQFPAITRHVFAQRYDTDGNTVWDQPAIISDEGSITAWTQIIPFIPDGEDGFYTAWHDYRTNPTLASIYVQHIASDGTVLFINDGVEVSLVSNRQHLNPQLALPTGSADIFIYWNEMDGNQDDRGIYGQKLSSTGERLWTDNGKSYIEISSTNVLAFAARNSIVDMVVFYEEYFDGMNGAIKAMRIDTEGNFVWENEKIDMCSVQSQKVHSVAGSFFNDQWIASWEDSRNGGKDIYAQNIQLDGSLGPIVLDPEIKIIPDTLFIDENFMIYYIHVCNISSVEYEIDTIFENAYWWDFSNIPNFPITIQSNDTLTLEISIVITGTGGTGSGYIYDTVYYVSEFETKTSIVAFNLDVIPRINGNFDIHRMNVFPNPAVNHVKFTMRSVHQLNYEILIFNSFGKRIISLFAGQEGVIRWDLTDHSNQKVPPGTYYYKLISNDHHEAGKIILIE